MITKPIIIDRTDLDRYQRTCELCGAEEECRPYGPNREWICFTCGMKDKATTGRVFARDVLDQGETH